MKKAKIKTPLRYPGGKNRAADMLVENMPTFNEYREPFIGGGSVFLAAKQAFPNAKYWINDLFFDVFSFWKMSKEKNESLVNKIKEVYDNKNDFGGKELYNFFKETYNITPSFDCIHAAWRFFVLNRITFSGTAVSGGFSQNAFEKRFTESSIERVKKIEPLLEGVEVTNQDYSELLNAEGEDVFIFMDPPYYTATKSALYGKNGDLHKGFNHERFAEECKKCKHKWMITYDDCEYIRELFKDYRIVPFTLMYGMRNVSKNAEMKGNEILIMNY